jgi:hypothetical protein
MISVNCGDSPGPTMRHCAKLLRATLTALLVLVALAGIAVAEPLEDGVAAYDGGDYATAYRVLRPLADQGNPDAQCYLGYMYRKGLGVSQNYAEAIRLYRLAADQGGAKGQHNLGVIYRDGFGVPKNDAEAVRWFRLAADQGDAEARHNLRLMHQNGFGVPKNGAEAEKWSRLPAASRAAVPLKIEGSTFVVPVQINGAITLDFTVDSGAADVSVPADVFSTLTRTRTIRDTDIIGEQTYVLADGSKHRSVTFTIRSLKVGDKIIENVRGSVAPTQGSLLLGQSFLERFKSWSIDNTKHELLLEPR